MEKSQIHRDKVNAISDKRTTKNNFQVDGMVLRWDANREDKGKHGKFNNIWFCPFRIAEILDNNTFVLKNMDDENMSGALVNGCFLKHYYLQ